LRDPFATANGTVQQRRVTPTSRNGGIEQRLALRDDALMELHQRRAAAAGRGAIGAVYDLIRKINHEVGSYASDVLAEASAPESARAATARKRKRPAGAHVH
jgi:hypothetical protein